MQICYFPILSDTLNWTCLQNSRKKKKNIGPAILFFLKYMSILFLKSVEIRTPSIPRFWHVQRKYDTIRKYNEKIWSYFPTNWQRICFSMENLLIWNSKYHYSFSVYIFYLSVSFSFSHSCLFISISYVVMCSHISILHYNSILVCIFS